MTAAVPVAQPVQESVLKPAALLMCGRAFAFLATFFIPIVLVRVFDQAQFGTYKQLFLIQTTVFLLAQFGMASSLYYFLPAAPLQGGRYIANALLFLSLAGLAGFGVLTAGAHTLSVWFHNPALAAYVPWIGLYCCLMMPASTLEIVLISRHKYTLAAASYAFSDLARAAAMIVPALLSSQLLWLLKSVVLVSAVRLAIGLIYFHKEFPSDFRLDKRLFHGQLAYAVPFGLAILVEVFQSNLPAYAVSYLTTPASFAIFAVGCLQIPLVDFAASPTSDVMMVHMQERLVRGQKQAVLAIWHDTTWKLALLFVPLVALLMVSARDIIILLFTRKYEASIPIFMAWTTLILLTTLQVDGCLRVFAETRTILVLNLVRLAVIASLLKLSMSTFQLLGPALLVVLATLVFKAGGLFRIKAVLEIRAADLLPWRKLAALGGIATFSAFVAFVFQTRIAASVFERLMATSVIYGVCFVALVWKFNILSDEERGSIVRMLSHPLRSWRS